MAVIAITLQPSTDIHLVLLPAARATLQLDVLSHDDAIVAPNSVRPNCTFAIANTTIADVSSTGVLTPKVAGRTFLTVQHTPTTGTATSVVARVWVHEAIADWWIGNNHGTVHAGEADLLLSAYALFSDNDVGDITGHGYVTFAALGANGTVSTAGRVTGVTAGDVTIRGTLDGTDRDVVVTVLPAASTLRPIVEPVRLSGPMDQRRNVLFLAEGFKDRTQFVNLVQKVVDRLVSNTVHEPFRILRNDMNYWLAFEPSHENGLTPGPPVATNGLMFMFDQAPTDPANLTFNQLVRLVGLPDTPLSEAPRDEADTTLQARFPTYQPARLEPRIFSYWQTWAGLGILQARDSRYGLMYARRPGDRTFTPDPKTADNSWYFSPTSLQELPSDPRRSPPNLTRWNNLYFDFLSSLRTKTGPSDPNHVIGPRWALNGDDQALVVFLCNDEAWGAFASKQIYSAVAVDFKSVFSKIVPGTVAVAQVDHEPDTTGFLPEVLVATVAHELGHQFFLGDEYEERPGIAAADIPALELDDNLTTQFILTTNGTLPLDPNRIKWNRLLRVDRASRLAGPATNEPGGNIQVPLAPGEGARWKPPEPAFVRTRNINPAALPSGYPLYRRHPFHHRIAQVVSVAGDVVTVSGGPLAAGEAYPAGSTLYRPKPDKAGTDFLRLVLPGVRTFMGGPPPRAVMDKAGSCAAPAVVLTLPPPIPGVTLAADDRPRVIGLYEGGGRCNCQVFRPAPVCKMRDHIWPRTLEASDRTQRRHFRFCFVCRYTIVNEVNPRRHPDLDLLYPGRET